MKHKSDEGSKGESAVSHLVAVSKTSVALLHLAFAEENRPGFLPTGVLRYRVTSKFAPGELDTK